MEELEPFIGQWEIEANFPGMGATGAGGRVTFEWALDGKYLLQRSEVDHPAAPDGLCVIAAAAEGEGYTQHYFDSRGVVRLYAMSFEDGVWKLSRTSPDFSPFNFSQRYVGAFSDDGNRIAGRWEIAKDHENWELDFGLDYTRIDQ